MVSIKKQNWFCFSDNICFWDSAKITRVPRISFVMLPINPIQICNTVIPIFNFRNQITFAIICKSRRQKSNAINNDLIILHSNSITRNSNNFFDQRRRSIFTVAMGNIASLNAYLCKLIWKAYRNKISSHNIIAILNFINSNRHRISFVKLKMKNFKAGK